MKVTNPFEIAKMSMFYNNFIYNEIVKRHIEEYDPETCDRLMIMLDTMSKHYVNYENNFCVVVGQALDLFRQISNGIKPIKSHEIEQLEEKVPELFNFKKQQKSYEWLLWLSKKYNILATEIPFPTDMSDIIFHYSKNFIPPIAYLFNTNNSDKFLVSLDSNSELSTIPIGNLKEKDIDLIKFQYIVHKITQKEDITKDEKDFFVKHSSQNKYSDIRIDSFIKYVIGLYFWDKYKNDGKRAGYELYQKYQQKFNKCNESKCFKEMEFDGSEFRIPEKLAIDFSCNRIETCKKFVREAFKLVGTCIHECKLYNSKHKCEFVYPENHNFFKRRKLSFFNGSGEEV